MFGFPPSPLLIPVTGSWKPEHLFSNWTIDIQWWNQYYPPDWFLHFPQLVLGSYYFHNEHLYYKHISNSIVQMFRTFVYEKLSLSKHDALSSLPYITYAQRSGNTRKLLEEDDFIAMLKRMAARYNKELKIVAMENLDVFEQIELMSHTHFLVVRLCPFFLS